MALSRGFGGPILWNSAVNEGFGGEFSQSLGFLNCGFFLAENDSYDLHSRQYLE